MSHAETEVIRVVVHSPQIDGDTVTFTWDEPFRTAAESMLFYRYEGIDLTEFSPELWLELWLALQLREYMGAERPVEIVLPSAIPAPSLAFWMTYYGLRHVTVSPVNNVTHYEALPKKPKPDQQFAAGVYFSGGRDSLATACALGEIYGRDHVLLMHCVDKAGIDVASQQRKSARAEQQILQPIRSIGFPVQRVFTNLMSIRRKFGKGPYEPHLEQYTAAFLPVLIARNVPISTFCYGWFEYVIVHAEKGITNRYPRSRPEVLAAQSRHYQRVLGLQHHLTNVNLVFSGKLMMRLLNQRYPDAFPFIFMCPNGSTSQRWCHNCAKCANYLRYSLALGVAEPGFDHSALLTTSRWVNATLAALNELESPPPSGENAAWQPVFAKRLAFANFCNAFASADPAYARRVLNGDAFFNFTVLKAFFGNRYMSEWDVTPEESFARQPGELGPKLRRIIAEYQEIVPSQPDLLETGGLICEGPFNRPYRPKEAELPHLQ